jgi:hypothetical protein
MERRGKSTLKSDMRPTIISADKKTAVPNSQRQQLNLELAEMREIADLMFKRLDGKMRELQTVEISLDKKKTEVEKLVRYADYLEKKIASSRQLAEALDTKISILQRGVQDAGSAQAPGGDMNRRQEISALIRKGLASREIAEVLDMPLGEVDLIIELTRHSA